MANLTETVNYDAGVYQIETTDPVSGGPNGVANQPLINLANRTAWLKQTLDSVVAGNTIPPTVAPLNSPHFTGTPLTTTPPPGDDSTKITDTAFSVRLKSGIATVDVSGNSNVTLSANQYGYGIIILTGTLTGAINVVFPNNGSWIVDNQTSGAYNLTATTALGTGFIIGHGDSNIVFADGTNIIAASSAGRHIMSRQTFTPAAGTSSLNVVGGYTPGAVLVMRNGAVLDANNDYLDTTSPTISLTNASLSGDVFEVYAFKAFTVANALQKSGDTMGGPLLLPEPAQFDNSTQAASTEFVQRALGNFQAQQSLTASTTLTATEAGQTVVLGGAGGLTATLPSASAVASGAGFALGAIASWTVQCAGSDTLTVSSAYSGQTSIPIPDGASLSLVSDGVSAWHAVGGTVPLAYGNFLAQSLPPSTFDIVAGSGPKPSSSAIIGGVAMVRPYTIPAGFTGSEARALTAFTNAASFPVNAYPSGSTTATQIGTVNFAAGATDGTFMSTSGAHTGASGDLVTVEAPATQDATGAGVAITINGTYS